MHLSDSPPIFRSCEASWYAAMLRPIEQLKKIANRYEPPVPVVCAGDIFHHWKVSPELINFALKHLPFMYAVPGQHDLPYHRLTDIHRSAYWTLVEANKVYHLVHRKSEPLPGMILNGFPWGCDIHAPLVPDPLEGFNVAVIHSYVWTKKCSYPNAPVDSHLRRWQRKLRGYRVAVFGDNHSGFLARDDNTTILNCGGFVRRNSDQSEYQPRVGLIWPDGNVTRVPLDVSQDRTATAEHVGQELGATAMVLTDFLEELNSLRSAPVDFVEALKRWMNDNKVLAAVREAVLSAVEGKR